MKYVEVMGLPGSGKTTLTQDTVALLRVQGREAVTRLEIPQAAMYNMMQQKSGWLWRGIRILAYVAADQTLKLIWEKTEGTLLRQFMGQYPRLISQIMDCAAWVEPPSWIDADILSSANVIKWFAEVTSFYQAGVDFLGKDALVFQEEGFCQHAYYLLAFRKGRFDAHELETYLQLIPKPDLLVFLSTRPEQCEARMQKRSKGVASQILRTLPVAQRISLLEQRLALYQAIAEYFEQHQVAIITLENDDYQTTQKLLAETLIRF